MTESAREVADESDFETGAGEAGCADDTPLEQAAEAITGDAVGPSRRHWLTNDGLAWLLVGSYPPMVVAQSMGVISLERVPSSVLATWMILVGTAAVWTFGRDALEAWRR